MAYQGRKKARTSNVLVLSNQAGLPLYIGTIQAGNQQDLFEIKAEFKQLRAWAKRVGLAWHKVRLNMDKGFDSKALRTICFRYGLIPNVKPIERQRRRAKPGPKRLFDEAAYKRRFVCERTFAWFDSFRTLLIRFETSVVNWKSWHYLAAFSILAKR